MKYIVFIQKMIIFEFKLWNKFNKFKEVLTKRHLNNKMILSGNIESKNFYLKNYQETPTKIKTYLGEAKVFRNTFTGDRVLAFY